MIIKARKLKEEKKDKKKSKYQSKLCSRGNSVKDGWHHERLFHFNFDLALNGESYFGDCWIPVRPDHLFVEQKYGVGFLNKKQGNVSLKIFTNKIFAQ